MREPTYRPLEPLGRREAEEVFRQGLPMEVGHALFRLAWYEQDWKWVRDTCLRYLASEHERVRYAAAECLSDLARSHPDPTWVPLLSRFRAQLNDPEPSVVVGLEGAIEFIERFSLRR